MIKFFRHIRKSLIQQNNIGKYFKYAIGEILLVVIGILIALGINNWNEKRKDKIQEKIILKNLQTDLKSDANQISWQLKFYDSIIKSYGNALNILSEKKAGSLIELKSNLQSILQVGGITQTKTTFKNLETTGEIRLIQDKELADNITKYYNSGFEGWQSALRDYTRHITAPYFLQFDHFPKFESLNSLGHKVHMPMEPSDFKLKEKTLEDYKNDYFVINTLRQKVWNLKNLKTQFQNLKQSTTELDKSIKSYLENQ